METTIMGFIGIIGWGIVKIMVPFLGPYDNTGPNLGDPKRDHNVDNYPYGV